MTHSLVSDLRLAAIQARALALILTDPSAQQGFLDLAAKWDSEASILETKAGESTLSVPFST
jgi:hypothetical protein